jgi:hypothetical protein
MCSFINYAYHVILLDSSMEERKVDECLGHVQWDVCTELSEILNHNEQSAPLLEAYMYTKLQTLL